MRSILLFIRFFAQITGLDFSCVATRLHCQKYLSYHNDFFSYALVPEPRWHYGKSYFLLSMATYDLYNGLFESQFYKKLDRDYINYCNMRNKNFDSFVKNKSISYLLPIEVLRFFWGDRESKDSCLPYWYKQKSTEDDFAKKIISFNLSPFILSSQ